MYPYFNININYKDFYFIKSSFLNSKQERNFLKIVNRNKSKKK